MSLAQRSDLREAIRAVREKPGRFLSEVEVPTHVFEQGRLFARAAPLEEGGQLCRFKMEFVYEMLMDCVETGQGAPSPAAQLEGLQGAVKALLRYALNLLLAPQRTEFRRIRLSTSYYVYQVAHKLKAAPQILAYMGYSPGGGGGELVYGGTAVDVGRVLSCATDLVVLHGELALMREFAEWAGAQGGLRVTLHGILNTRRHGLSFEGLKASLLKATVQPPPSHPAPPTAHPNHDLHYREPHQLSQAEALPRPQAHDSHYREQQQLPQAEAVPLPQAKARPRPQADETEGVGGSSGSGRGITTQTAHEQLHWKDGSGGERHDASVNELDLSRERRSSLELDSSLGGSVGVEDSLDISQLPGPIIESREQLACWGHAPNDSLVSGVKNVRSVSVGESFELCLTPDTPHVATSTPGTRQRIFDQWRVASEEEETGQTGRHQDPGQTGRHQDPGQTDRHQDTGQTDRHQDPGQTVRHQDPNQTYWRQDPDQIARHQDLGQTSWHQDPSHNGGTFPLPSPRPRLDAYSGDPSHCREQHKLPPAISASPSPQPAPNNPATRLQKAVPIVERSKITADSPAPPTVPTLARASLSRHQEEGRPADPVGPTPSPAPGARGENIELVGKPSPGQAPPLEQSTAMTEGPTPLFAGGPAPLGLGDSWECTYCLNLMPSSYVFCDTCGRDRGDTA